MTNRSCEARYFASRDVGSGSVILTIGQPPQRPSGLPVERHRMLLETNVDIPSPMDCRPSIALLMMPDALSGEVAM
jgi:hypothetical protein